MKIKMKIKKWQKKKIKKKNQIRKTIYNGKAEMKLK